MKKIGILGGGQLGRMFLQNALNYPYEYWILDPSPEAPARNLCHHFVQGDFNDYQTVLDFGKNVDVLGIEIEHVNIEALEQLKEEGIRIVPEPKILKIIQDKALQKEFYRDNNIPTSDFYLIENQNDLKENTIFPVVQKFRKGGYDGKGVKILNSVNELIKDTPSVIEDKVDIAKELAVIVVNRGNQIISYPVVEMVFNQELNLVDELFAPAELEISVAQEAQRLALQVVKSFDAEGIYAIELFLTKSGELLVNEVAPRVHNSGHHTIEANYSSQFDAMLRVLADMDLADNNMREEATMINLIGGEAKNSLQSYLPLIADIDKTYVHWYGKSEEKPGRKMGHVTILGSRNSAKEKIQQIQKILKQ